MSPLNELLADQLRQRRIDALIADAQFIRRWPDECERLDQGQKLIRYALGLRALSNPTHDGRPVNGVHQITDDELHRLYRVLDFAYEQMVPKTILQSDEWECFLDGK